MYDLHLFFSDTDFHCVLHVDSVVDAWYLCRNAYRTSAESVYVVRPPVRVGRAAYVLIDHGKLCLRKEVF